MGTLGQQQKRYKAKRGERCAFCHVPLAPGAYVVRGLTREPYHRECRSVARTTGGAHTIPAAHRGPEFCAACGQLTDDNPPSRQGVHYHRECLM